MSRRRPGGRIEPLPEITPYEVFTYVADAEGHRSPFVPDSPQAAAGMAAGGTGGTPGPGTQSRVSGAVSARYAAHGRHAGTWDTQFGLVQTSDGLIHRVVPGNYMGQNDGRIIAVNDSEIELVEIISDGIGGYLEREAAVGLAD